MESWCVLEAIRRYSLIYTKFDRVSISRNQLNFYRLHFEGFLSILVMYNSLRGISNPAAVTICGM